MTTLRELGTTWNIPVVQARELGNSVDAIVNSIRGMSGVEGFVLRFDDGQMFKIKCDEYVSMHKARDNLTMEKNVIDIISNDKVDDMLPLLFGEDKDKLIKFSDDFHHNVRKTADRLYWIALSGMDNTNKSKKRFALEIVNNHSPHYERSILFSIFDKLMEGDWSVDDTIGLVMKVIKNNTGTSTKVDSIRGLFGSIKWDEVQIISD
jgi:hypothetical protein